RPPPSAFPAFPFQSHPGNPDPGTHIPGVPRRSSLDSFRNVSVRPTSSASVRDSQNAGLIQNNSAGVGSVYAAGYNPLRGSSSLVDLDRPEAGYVRDREREGTPTPPPFVGGNAVYRNSAAAAMSSNSALVSPAGDNMRASIPRTSSVPSIAMRAPFLSPASRPSSSVWSPPAYPSNPYYAYPPGTSTPPLPSLPYNSGPNPTGTGTPTQTQSNFFLPRRSKPPLPSSRLAQKLTPSEKPWLKQKERRARASWWLTLVCFGLGIAASAVVCYFGWTGVKWLEDGELCEVFRDDFESAELDGDKWVREVELGGFGNGEFQMTTNKPENLKLQNGQLYLIPTLTSDEIGKDAITNKGNYTLDGCTATSNRTACSASSDSSRGTVINPVKSARISTKGKAGITFGKVEVRAKNPRGDWLWPAVWMLPQDDSKYGKWPLGGEIDIMEARGNGPSYPAQGVNFVRSSLNYGPLPTLLTHLFGWWSNKRATYDKSFHTYAFEWTPDWMRFYVDDRLQAMMNVKMTGRGGKSFFERGDYPETARNGSDVQVVVQDVWSMNGGSRAAPFDQEFYLILDLATGGTSGWFPDGVGGKPWFDGSATAMRDFANAQDTWSATWPESEDDRAFRIDYVRMWKLGKC
ncbi:concanavalin A-like lectin/glucanase, partial [Panus rudis PR-1116 ss-1]